MFALTMINTTVLTGLEENCYASNGCMKRLMNDPQDCLLTVFLLININTSRLISLMSMAILHHGTMVGSMV